MRSRPDARGEKSSFGCKQSEGEGLGEGTKMAVIRKKFFFFFDSYTWCGKSRRRHHSSLL